ncbi:uncharacterized protein LOC134692475 [Mytilus trossulus]|uniref:uncharacterized protein LOC134692475 n=1 Tax=Mytilus trossulus TaxID=6551 RepID=UPI0030052E60
MKMVIPYVIVLLCLVSPSTQFNPFNNFGQDGFDIGQGIGNTQVFDDAESASIIQTGESFPAQVSVVDSGPADIGPVGGGGDGFGGLLMMGLPLLLLLAALGGGAGLTATAATPAAAAAAAATACPVCTTPVQATCPTTAAQCSPRAACPAGFAVVTNADANKCYRVIDTDSANYRAASVACSTAGGSLFEARSTQELNAIREIIPTSNPAPGYYIGFNNIGAATSNPTGVHTGVSLPANGQIPDFSGTTVDCVQVRKTGTFEVKDCGAPAKVLCEARLDKVNCVCP